MQLSNTAKDIDAYNAFLIATSREPTDNQTPIVSKAFS